MDKNEWMSKNNYKRKGWKNENKCLNQFITEHVAKLKKERMNEWK